MVRNVFASLLALAGAAAALFSPFRPWFAGRYGRDYRLRDLFTGDGITGGHDTILYGLFLPMLVAAGLALLLALPLLSRSLLATASIVVLGFAVLWMVRQGQAAGSLTVGGAGGAGIGDGLGYAWGGGMLLLISALVLRGRRPHGDAYGPEPGHGDGYASEHDQHGDDFGRGYGNFGRGYGHPHGDYGGGHGGYGYPPPEQSPYHAPYRQPRPDPHGLPPGTYDAEHPPPPPPPPPEPQEETPPQPWDPSQPPGQPPTQSSGQPLPGGAYEVGRPPPDHDDTQPLPRRSPSERPDDR